MSLSFISTYTTLNGAQAISCSNLLLILIWISDQIPLWLRIWQPPEDAYRSALRSTSCERGDYCLFCRPSHISHTTLRLSALLKVNTSASELPLNTSNSFYSRWIFHPKSWMANLNANSTSVPKRPLNILKTCSKAVHILSPWTCYRMAFVTADGAFCWWNQKNAFHRLKWAAVGRDRYWRSVLC